MAEVTDFISSLDHQCGIELSSGLIWDILLGFLV